MIVADKIILAHNVIEQKRRFQAISIFLSLPHPKRDFFMANEESYNNNRTPQENK